MIHKCLVFSKVTLVLFLCSFINAQLQAKKLYKYQDNKGNWHFSDKPPKNQQNIEVRQLKAGTKRYVWLEKTGGKQSPEYFVINNYKGPIELEVKLIKPKNVQSSPQLPARFVIQPGKSKILFRMSAINQFRSWGYSLQYRYTIGDPQAIHNDQYAYSLPFAKQSSFQVTQAFGGKFSHSDKQNHFAVDFAMPVNTALYAARDGVVIEVNNDFYKNGTTKTYKSRANSIRILHSDGSMAIYAHLALEKAQVYPGLKVFAGQLIGYSGNTGFSTGPHLHFAIQVNKGMSLESVPFKFTDAGGGVIVPQAGSWLVN